MSEACCSAFVDRLIAVGGETGGLIARRDWTLTALGPIETWPQSLKTTTEFMLRSAVPLVMLWGEDGVMLYNDAYSVFAGGRHPELLGSKVRKGWAEVADFNDNVMKVGLAGGTLSYKDQELTLYRNGQPEQVFMNLDYSPVPGDDGRPAGVMAIVVETTDRVRTERREAFRLELKARLRELSDPEAVMAAAVEALGVHLGANRVGYSEIHEDDDAAMILACYADGVAPFSGSHKLSTFGRESNARQSYGRMEVCEDIDADPAQAGGVWPSIETRAFASVPLIRNGRFTASLFVNFREPHKWTDDEVALIEDVAARTWEALERARAEARARRALLEQAETASALNALIANAPIGFAFFDRGHRYTRINDLLAQINGIPAQAHLGRSIEDLLPINAKVVGPVLDQVFATGEPVSGIEVDGETPASPGELRCWLTGFFPVLDRDGAVVEVGATVVDITERKRAEAQLRTSEERLRLATEHAEVGFWDVDEVHQVLHWPPLVKAMFGISPDAPVSMDDFYQGLHPAHRDAVSKAYAAAADPAERALYDVEYRTVGKEDGVIRWVAAKGRGVFDDQGRCLRVLGTVVDIGARKAAEDALAKSEARLRDLNRTLEARVAEALAEQKLLADIVDGTDIFVQVADLDFNWLAINEASAREFSRTFGVPQPKAGDNMLRVLEGHSECEAVRAVWARALAGDEFVEIQEFGDKSIDRRYYEMRFRTLKDAEGRLIGAYQFVSDVTERLQEQRRLMEAEAALAQAQKMDAIGQLTCGIAHDFNNLLGAVVGSFDLIRRKPEDTDRVRRYADAGLQAAERGAKLTGQLLAFSRSQRLEVKPVIVSKLVEQMRDLLDRTLGPLIRLNVELEGDGAALSDPTQLEMAILNLAINARDAMPDGGDLTIRTQPWRIAQDVELEPGDYVQIAVQDTGTGMPPEVVARAFDPFFTTKGVGKGTGLGLSQVYGIARQAGGTVRIDSRPGEGTTIYIYLRNTDAAPETETGDDFSALTDKRGSARVLIVDDDPDLRRVLAASLEDLGYEVLEASNGPMGLELAETAGPDLMMVDFALPGMNGAQVAQAARERWPDLPIVFASGYSDTDAIERAAIDAPVLRKPFRVDQLQEALDQALGR